MFKPFADEQLQDLEERFGAIDVYTPEPKARKSWSKPLPAGAAEEPPFSLVFRACTAAEWASIQKQINDPRVAHSAPENLAMASIVAVSIGGTHTIHSGTAGTAPNDREASKGPREALKVLIAMPGCVGIPADVASMLGRLNGVNAEQSEKG